jgi:glutathione S-transferase
MYDLWYWDEIPGRGEFVRLALEAGGIPYRERVRSKDGGDAALVTDLGADRRDPPFAPPYLVAGRMTIAQTANILQFLGEKHGLAPKDVRGRYWIQQLQLTIADMVAEVHDAHHPLDSAAYYEDQKDAAKARAAAFRKQRMPKFLGYFERVLEARGAWLNGGRRWFYADLSLFHLVDGLRYAFPKRSATVLVRCPRVADLHARVAALPSLQPYLLSDRRMPWGEGIFRHYPELDAR